jgi:hypothetical protein
MDTARFTRTDTIDLGQIDLRDGIETCPTCGHPRDSHDDTARRFCAATRNLAIARRCVCADDVLDHEQRMASSHRFGYASTLNQGR